MGFQKTRRASASPPPAIGTVRMQHQLRLTARCRPPTTSPRGKSAPRWCSAKLPMAFGQTGAHRSTPDIDRSPEPPASAVSPHRRPSAISSAGNSPSPDQAAQSHPREQLRVIRCGAFVLDYSHSGEKHTAVAKKRQRCVVDMLLAFRETKYHVCACHAISKRIGPRG